MQIKTSISKETNNLLIFIYWKYYDGNTYSDCFFYNITKNKLDYIYYNIKTQQNYVIYYFNETKSFILIFGDINQNFYLYIINDLTKEYNGYYNQSYNECNKINSFDINYNNISKGYDLISDCYINNNENKWNVVYNNSLLESIFFYPLNLSKDDEDDFSSYEEQKEEELEENQEQEIQKIELKIDKEELLNNLTNLINNIEIGNNYEFIGEDYNVVIKPINSSYLESSTHINFTQCEITLRNILNISSSRILTFLQMEINNKNDKSITNNVGYQVHDDNKNLLDLSLCNDSNIQIFHSIKNSSLIDLNSISSFKNIGIDILNINDSFFNDICHIQIQRTI